MVFTPKFVDLVRNFTTSQGTGPVTLGAAVSGYAGLAEALSVGDQFYYCMQSVDRPQEREVGRGTLQANGKVGREAVSGGLTDFSNGTKTIALVAAAEWFSKLETGGAGGGALEAANTAALAARTVPSTSPALLVEAGREGLFVWDSSDWSDQIAADSAEGMYVAPASDPSGASGAWVRKFDGPVNPAWFGLVEGANAGANGAANSAVLAAMLATLRARAVNVESFYQGLETVRFPAGYFELAETIELTDGSLIIEGADVARPGGHATKLKFPSGVTGIRVQTYNTSGVSGPADSPTHRGGQATIRHLALYGGYTDTEREAHGIQLRGQANIEHCFIDLFEGDAIYAVADVTSATAFGNVNLSHISYCRLQRCRNGIYFDGADANACTIIAVDCSSNREWGFKDSSFLGNSYFGCHTATNGTSAGGSPPAMVSDGTNRYGVVAGQEAGASTNAPSGTTADNQWWYWMSVGGPHTSWPLWVSGTTYRAGGAAYSDNGNARNVFVGCYREGNEGEAQLARPSMVIGGMLAGAIHGNILQVGTDFITAPAINTDNLLGATRIAKSSGAGAPVFKVHQNAGLTAGMAAAMEFDQGYETDGVTPLALARISAKSSTADPATAVGSLTFSIRLAGGSMSDELGLNGTELYPATSGGLALGNVARLWSAADITTIRGYGAITTSASNQGVGYRAGAGLAATQASSKSTGVTMSRPCGQVTMHNATLAAGASVSFTLTNSVIAATDVVIVNIGGGATADSYDVCVTAVAAGSCRIQLRNVSAGDLAEAPVLNFAVVKAVAA